MNIHKIDLNLLAVFDCIYTHGSVTRAAEVLHLTQPSVSHALNRLRERLDDPLFIRNGKKLTPTATAHKLITPVQQALRILESALSDMDVFDPSESTSRFTIGLRPLLESAYFPGIIDHIYRQAPNMELSSIQLTSENLESDLSNGKMSVAVDVFRSTSDNIQSSKLSTTPIVVLARQGHPAIQNNTLNLEHYLQQDHVLVSSRSEGYSVEDHILAKQDKRRKIRVRCQHVKTGLQLIQDSDLLMTLSRNLIGQEMDSERYCIVDAPFSSPEVDIYLYWHISSDTDKGSVWLRENIVQLLKKAPVSD